MSSKAAEVHAGLDDVVVASTRLSSVDGLAGELIIAGYPLKEIAPNAVFEESVYLLWYGRLPSADELREFKQLIAANRVISKTTIDLLREAAQRELDPMDALRMACGTLDLQAIDATASSDAIDPRAIMLIAQIPTISAAYARLRNGKEPVEPDPRLGQAANYLYMLNGKKPSDGQTRALDTYLNTVIDHGLNASTFAARVITATGSDLVSAITGAIGALKGPLHGGAPGPALDMVFEIEHADRAEEVIRAKLERGERLMGFGHRIYKVRDPRADVLGAAATKLFEAGEADPALYQLARDVEAVALRLLEERKPGRNLQINVEYYTALLLHGLGMSVDVFSPTFAMSRAAGWIAHCFEQRELARIIRPQSIYGGPAPQRWTPLEER